MNDLAYSDALKELYLEHHGIKGQKHGVRNGPPYPLQRNKSGGIIKKVKKTVSKVVKKKKKTSAKKKEESEAEIREKVLKSTDPKYIYKHRDVLSSNELQDRLTHINRIKQLKDLAEPKNQAYNIAKKGDSWLKTTSSMTKSVSEIVTALNTIAKLANGDTETTDKTKDQSDDGKKQKKKKKQKK